MTFYKWSQTSATNATADSTVNYQEGQAPSSLNDSARAAMAALAKYRDDVAGAIATAGTSTAYTVSSFQAFDTLAHMSGQTIAFTPHTTNGATVTLNVDGLGAKALRSAPNVEIPSGVLVAGTPYVALYSNSDGAFYLHGFYNSPALVPLGTLLDYTGSTAPSSSFVIPIGQAISRTTYANLFSLIGTTYGSGDGSTTFTLPNLRGRVVAMIDSTATIINSATMTPDGSTLGATGGGQASSLVTANLPPYTPAGSIANGAISISHNAQVASNSTTTGGGGFPCVAAGGASISASQAASTFTGTAQGGTSTVFTNMQPTIALNKIMRVL
ncbi:phage tail protein [Bradyrhizobium sp. WU425]|uniref:phage tail protein n=1 Tax=Bradyrhizobium sp. WU425 TaxID=187029 RepID=UPI001E2925FA|nr:tail fiber protein [Bradyrhizobium canariense]UFW75524.1 phage tail protein [Bradyrhizobium canariense]